MRVDRSVHLLLILSAVVGCADGGGHHAEQWTPPVPSALQRIVCMAPSVTEVAFALGLGDRVVGVTRYCDYPEEARHRMQVGGYLDPNYEAIVGLEPDLVLLIQDHAEARSRLERLGIATLQVDHHDVSGILDSITTIAEVFGVADRGATLVTEIRTELHEIEERIGDLEVLRVLIVVGRDSGRGSAGTVWAAGPESYYHDILTLAGGENACGPSVVAYPELSREGIAYIDPDVILDVVPEVERAGLDPERARSDWDAMVELKAVRNGRVHVLAGDLMEIPGPRIAEVVGEVARILHPEAGWGGP